VPLTDVDRGLIKRCLTSEPGGWRDFVERYAGLFAHVIQHTAHARSVRLNADDIDDLSSEIMLAIVANECAVLRNFRGDSALSTYLTVVARRVVVREMSQRRMAEAMGHVKSHGASIDQAAAPVENGRIENQELVERMLSGLPPLDAEVVRRYHLEGQSYREISSRLGVPENSIGPTLTRAREKLRHTTASGLA
jgi:RNA polymerase sigma-70 factor, ECF subfamily